MKSWLTVAEAAIVAGRHQSRIYRWINNPDIHLRTRTTPEGVVEVCTADVLRVESVTKRGRPRGSVSVSALTKKGTI